MVTPVGWCPFQRGSKVQAQTRSRLVAEVLLAGPWVGNLVARRPRFDVEQIRPCLGRDALARRRVPEVLDPYPH